MTILMIKYIYTIQREVKVMKIAILGMGGIGGLVGGALAKKNNNIYFISRGKNLETIKTTGLRVNSDLLGDFSVYPKLATDNVSEIGIVDILIIATKSYGLEAACKQCLPIIGSETVVVPLLNGVLTSDDIEIFLDNHGQIADGCIYGFCSLETFGVVRHIGELCRIDFGFKDARQNEKCLELAKMLAESGIKTNFSDNVRAPLWQKYIMMCGNSCAFSYFECSADIVHSDSKKMEYIKNVYTELYTLAKLNDVTLPTDLVENYMETFKRLPVGAITSLYRDLKNPDKKTEFEAIIGKGYRLARAVNLDTPGLDAAYNKNKGR